MKKLITAYNKDVQKYMTGNELSSRRKNTIIEHIEKMVVATGESFERLFPARSKRKDVMDHIIYLLSGNGICKISANTLAGKADCSVRTVNAAVNAVKKTGEVLVAGLADGKNKYVFVLKSHENFKAIMKDVFYINAEQIAEENAEHVAEHKNSEHVEAVCAEDEKTGSNNNNSFSSSISFSKQEKDSIRDSIESDLKSSEENYTQYYVNEYQHILHDTIKQFPYHTELKHNASILGLRLGSNATKPYLQFALRVLSKIDSFLNKKGTVSESIPALFTKMYTDLIEYGVQKKGVDSPKYPSKPSFNWLDVGGSKEPIRVKEINCTMIKDDFKLAKNEADEMGLF